MALMRGRGEDTLMRFCTVCDNGNALSCNHCDFISRAQLFRSRRANMKNQLKLLHTDIYTEDYIMTAEDAELKADLELLGLGTDGNMHYRKYACFDFNATANRANWAYCAVPRDVWNEKEVIVHEELSHPGQDKFFDQNNQLGRGDFGQRAVPPNYEMGHYLALEFFRWSREHFLHVNVFSLVGIQHHSLNDGLWRQLEEAAFGMTLHRKVRVLTGTAGELRLPRTSRAQIPRFWYYVILSSDLDNQNWQYSAHVFPNLECKEPLSAYEVSIYNVIALSGMNLFKNIVSQMTTLLVRAPLQEPFWDWVERTWFPESEVNEDPSQ